ncbi:hypothetical protein FEE95_19995 [Maribacter algarum]|uniref:Uncharacterized protein n=1 Tax=Maribacter algarum (ex Zhang et al. 2020) TaxID=2578118 RepID=A0A5S3PGW4_9FLAO|nr:hypothetical protein [Maribacter algarum]TMM53347.1 hypothetical protein FEE95_19995 [Maribacter algarum]
MSIRKSIFITIIALGLLSACGEQKPKEVKIDSAEVEKRAAELKAKAAQEEAELRAAKERVEDSLRKLDSLQQVKEHGHAH